MHKQIFYCFMASLLMLGCKKMDHELATRSQESGIVRLAVLSQDQTGLGQGAVRIGDTVDVITKIGLPTAPVKLNLGETELTIITNTAGIDTIVDLYSKKITALLPVQHLKIRIPPDFPVGFTNFSLAVNGERKPAFSVQVVKPLLLFPGKTSVSAALVTPQQHYITEYGLDYLYNPFVIKDGGFNQATSSRVTDVAVDKNTGVVYFLDQTASDTSDGLNSQRIGPIYLRRLQSGSVTTIGGNGTDVNAANIANKKFTYVTSMKIGPDGMLYLALIDKIPSSAQGTRYTAYRPQIVRLDPASGNMTSLIGYHAKPDTLGSYQAFADGKTDTARIYSPLALEFDKKGNLWFLDGTQIDGSFGGILRMLGTDSTLQTIMGQYMHTTKRVLLADGTRPTIPAFALTNEGHIDGFAAEARLGNEYGIAMAGNGKLYLAEGGGGNFNANIREVNPDTRELSSIIGLPVGTVTSTRTGTFKEVDLFGTFLSSIDVDYDGNILFATNDYGGFGGMIYKMDLNAEEVSLIAGGSRVNTSNPLLTPVPGTEASFYIIHRIVFDLTGQLFIAADAGRGGVNIPKISIER